MGIRLPVPRPHEQTVHVECLPSKHDGDIHLNAVATDRAASLLQLHLNTTRPSWLASGDNIGALRATS